MSDWSWREQLKLAGYTALAQLMGLWYWYKKAKGLSDLKIHILRERAKVPPEFRRYIMARDHMTCYLCGHYKCWVYFKPMVIEHDIPLVRGGFTSYQNCWLSCWHCNEAKGTLTAQEYRAKIRVIK